MIIDLFITCLVIFLLVLYIIYLKIELKYTEERLKSRTELMDGYRNKIIRIKEIIEGEDDGNED